MPLSTYDWWPRPKLTEAELAGMRILSNAIGRARRAAGLSQYQLARIADVHPSTISRLENGRLLGMRFRTLARIIAACNGLLILHGSEPPRRPLSDGRLAPTEPWWADHLTGSLDMVSADAQAAWTGDGWDGRGRDLGGWDTGSRDVVAWDVGEDEDDEEDDEEDDMVEPD